MCGFFVIKSKKKNFNLNKKKFIFCTKMMQHRGPDDLNYHFEKDIFFGFNRLSIIDLSKNGSQPFLNEKKDKVLVYNGEIYNAQKLRDEELNNQNFIGYSDTEVLMRLYQKLNDKMLNKIRGMFAFLLLDKKKDEIVIVRDQFGIKPLYYYQNKDLFIFSSEIKPIIKYTNKNEISDKSIIDYFILGKQDYANNTFFKDIMSVEPGTLIKIKKNIMYKEKYWDIYDKKIQNFKSPKYFFNSYKNKMDSIIDEYLISDRKISTFLSGGIDSSIMSTLVQSKINYKLDTFTYGFKNYKGEEILSNSFSKKINSNNVVSKIGPADVVKNIDKIISKTETPITSLRLIAVDKLYKEVKSHGYNVVIEGAGGDELLGGYKYNFIPYLADSLNKKKLVERLILDSFQKKKFIEKKMIDKIITLSNQGGSTTDGTPFVQIDLFNKEYLDKNLDESFFLENDYMNYKHFNYLQKSQFKDMFEIKLPKNLNFTDKISMSYNIETRLPYLNQDLVKMCFNLKNNLKFNNEKSRWIAIRHVKSLLKSYKSSNKVSIVDPQRNWIKKSLFEFVYDNFNSSEFKNLPYFNFKKIIKLINNYKKDENNFTSYNIFQILSFYRFYKTFKKL